MNNVPKSFLSAERSVPGASLFKIREQTSRNVDLIISGDRFILYENRKHRIANQECRHLRQEVQETPAIFDQSTVAFDSQIREAPGIEN